jgi:signal transduction histidine kinase
MDRKEPLIDLLIHDLTGPLAIVSSGVSDLLTKQDRCGPITDRQKATLERISRNAGRARNLLEEMIEVYRSEEGLYRRDSFLVEDATKDAVMDALDIINPELADRLAAAKSGEECRRLAEEAGISIEITGKYAQAMFSQDQKKVVQIFRNLISNALKYRREKIRITLSGDTDLVIAVEDDGAGIPAEKQDYVFKRFFRQKSKIKHRAEGLGFGLSCVKVLVETMNGAITMKSVERAGTCFTVRIPPI